MTTRLGRLGPSRSESGTTLIELLVTIVIMGVAFVVIVGGIGTAIIGSDIQKNQAGADVVARSAAEDITAQPYQPCTATPAVTPAYAFTAPSGFDVTTTPVSYWNSKNNKFQANCPDEAAGGDAGLQLVSITATSAPGTRRPSTETVELVKRRP